MRLLDELKKEADQLKKALSDDERKRQLKQAYYHDVLFPSMQKIFHFLRELIDHLKTVTPDMDISYAIPGYRTIGGIVQEDYRIDLDSDLQTRRILLSFNCLSHDEVQFSVHDKSQVKEINAFLRSQRIEFSEWGLRDKNSRLIGATFEFKFKIQAVFQFDVDVENGRIILNTRNFDGLKTTRKSYQAEQITDQWLDGLGRYILRMQATPEQEGLSQESLEKIRRQIKKEKLEREQELQAAIDRIREAEELERASSFGKTIRDAISHKLSGAADSIIGTPLKQKPDESAKKK